MQQKGAYVRIKEFKCAELNRQITNTYEFRNDITFLVGINGSGKTTVVNAIVSLLSPNVIWLCNQPFTSLQVSIEYEGKQYKITANKSDDRLHLETDYKGGAACSIDFKTTLSNYWRREEHVFIEEGEYLVEDEAIKFEPEVEAFIAVIDQLPTPTYLGLDRSANLSANQRRLGPRRTRRRLTKTNIDTSLQDAERLVSQAYSEFIAQRTRLTSIMRRDIILSLFRVEEQQNAAAWWPKKEDTDRFKKMQQSFSEALVRMDIGADEVATHLNPFFTRAIEVYEQLQQFKDLQEALKLTDTRTARVGGKSPLPPLRGEQLMTHIQAWFALVPKIPLINTWESTINIYNENISMRYKEIENFLYNLDQFLSDSGKYLSFDNRGEPFVQFKGNTKGTVFDLSSGEKQLFVLLSHLSFNKRSKASNILIIDEPELSLHLRWQEIFVNAIYSANKNLQSIFATHSPSIIAGREKNCIDLSV